MNIATFMENVAQSGLANHADYLRKIVRPAVDILPTETIQRLGSSKFDGSPDMPPGTEWPSHHPPFEIGSP